MTNSDTSSIATVSGFSYSIRSAPALNLPIDGLTMVGDARDMERGVLHLVSHAKYPYLPVQAIPQGMAKPDLVVDVADGPEILTTLHFCTIWRGMQRDPNPENWERISFPKLQMALLYNDARLSLCRVCQRLHKYSCVIDQQANMSMKQVIAANGLEICVSGKYVYLIAWSEDHPLYGDLFHGTIYRYAAIPTLGLQEYPQYEFVRMVSCTQYLIELGVSLDAGWQAGHSCPSIQL